MRLVANRGLSNIQNNQLPVASSAISTACTFQLDLHSLRLVPQVQTKRSCFSRQKNYEHTQLRGAVVQVAYRYSACWFLSLGKNVTTRKRRERRGALMSSHKLVKDLKNMKRSPHQCSNTNSSQDGGITFQQQKKIIAVHARPLGLFQGSSTPPLPPYFLRGICPPLPPPPSPTLPPLNLSPPGYHSLTVFQQEVANDPENRIR